MTYRDEKESLRARVGKLEQQLAEADAQIARLRGESPVTLASRAAPEARDRVVGEPVAFDDVVDLPYRLSERGYEAIAALLAERLGIEVAQVGSTLKGGGFAMTCEGDTTRVTLRTDLRRLRGGVMAGGWLAVLFAGLPALGVVLDATHGGMPMALHALWALPAIAAGGSLAMRRVAGRRAREGRAKHHGTLAAVLELAEEHRLDAGGAARVRVRVAAGEAEESEQRARAHDAERADAEEAPELASDLQDSQFAEENASAEAER